MFKNQLQELAQRSCFNLPSYACVREGPDHAPRFKATVNFNGEFFESPGYRSTLRQAEHAAAETALNLLSSRGSRSLTARVLDETGVYKNLLQETAHKAGLKLPVYTTERSGPGHVPVFTCTVDIAGLLCFTGEPARSKKQAEKNAAIAAWSSLKKMPLLDSLSTGSSRGENNEVQEQAIVRRVLSSFRPRTADKYYYRNGDDLFRPSTTRRRMYRRHYYRDNSSTIKSQIPNSLIHHPASSRGNSECSSHRKQNSFLDLLPPPPPRPASKNLPSSNRSSFEKSPSAYSLNSMVTTSIPEIPEPMKLTENGKEDGQGDKSNSGKNTVEKEESTTSTTTSVMLNHVEYKPFLLPDIQNEESRWKNMLARSCVPTPMPVAAKESESPVSCSHLGKMAIYPQTGRFISRGIAPAVQIRSVVPVCAAPARASTLSTRPKLLPTLIPEASSAYSFDNSYSSVTIDKKEVEVSESSSSDLSKAESGSSSLHISSELKKLQLGEEN